MNDDLRLMYKLMQDALYASYIKNDNKEVEKISDKIDNLIYKKYNEDQKKAAKLAMKSYCDSLFNKKEQNGN